MSTDKLNNMIDMASRIFSRWRVNAIEIEKHPELFAFASNEIADLSDAFDALRTENARLQAERDAALAAVQWQPLTEADAPVIFDKPFRTIVQPGKNGDLFVAQPNEDGSIGDGSDDDGSTVALFNPGPDHAFCRRNPAAQVWRPVADGFHCAQDVGGDSMKMNYKEVGGRRYLSIYIPGMGLTYELPPSKALCELVGGGDV